MCRRQPPLGVQAEDVQQAVMADVTAFIGARKVLDDLTLVVLKRR